MTPAQNFASLYSGDLKVFLATDAGRALMYTLHDMRLPPVCDPHEHQSIYRLGAISGYEKCERNILELCQKIELRTNPEANYGVKDKK